MWLKTYTYRQKSPDVVLSSENQRAAVPEGQSVGHVDHEVCKTHSNVYCNGFFYANILGVFQIFPISVKKAEIVK